LHPALDQSRQNYPQIVVLALLLEKHKS